MIEKEKKISVLHSRYLYISILLISIIYALICVNQKNSSIYSIEDTSVEGVVTKYQIDGDKLSFYLNGKEKIKCNYYIKSEEEKKSLEKEVKIGSIVKTSTELSYANKNTIPNTFNYSEYLVNHDINYICNSSKLEIDNSQISIFNKIKNSLIDRAASFEIGEYMMNFIVGDKSLMDQETMNSYRLNGISHLFAISGMHIGLFSSFLLFILKRVGIREKKRYSVTTIFMWFYAFITSFSPSVLRATMLYTMVSINKITKANIKSLYLLMLSVSILLFITPKIITEVGFIYSAVTTFSLIYASKTIAKHKIIGLSVISFLASLPITISNFYEFNCFSIFLNIIFVPLVSLIIYPLCCLTYILPAIETITKFFISIMEVMNSVGSKINFLTFASPGFNLFLYTIYYFLFFLLINKKFKLCLLLLSAIVLLNANRKYLDENFYVTFFDVSQGDSALIRFPHNRGNILIDTGGIVSFNVDKWRERREFHVTDNIITYMHSLGINKLNYLILTHGDFDHMGEAVNLVNNFKVEKVIFNCGEYNDLEKELIKVLNKKNIKYYSCISELNIKDNKLYFLQTREYDNENDNSNVIYTEIDGHKFMFMGDASTTAEKEILSKYNLPDIDVLKVGHHGSKTSSSKEFINEINPKYSIISVGKNNRYGHPNKEVLNTLEDSKIYRTDEDGSIMFKIKDNKLQIKTCSP